MAPVIYSTQAAFKSLSRLVFIIWEDCGFKLHDCILQICVANLMEESQ